MQFFARLMLNRRGIVLQLIVVLVKPRVLCPQLLHLLLQLAGLGTFVREHRQPVVSEDDAISHHERQRASAERGELAPRIVDSQTHCGDCRNETPPLRILLLSAQNHLTRSELCPVSRSSPRKFEHIGDSNQIRYPQRGLNMKTPVLIF